MVQYKKQYNKKVDLREIESKRKLYSTISVSLKKFARFLLTEFFRNFHLWRCHLFIPHIMQRLCQVNIAPSTWRTTPRGAVLGAMFPKNWGWPEPWKSRPMGVMLMVLISTLQHVPLNLLSPVSGGGGQLDLVLPSRFATNLSGWKLWWGWVSCGPSFLDGTLWSLISSKRCDWHCPRRRKKFWGRYDGVAGDLVVLLQGEEGCGGAATSPGRNGNEERNVSGLENGEHLIGEKVPVLLRFWWWCISTGLINCNLLKGFGQWPTISLKLYIPTTYFWDWFNNTEILNMYLSPLCHSPVIAPKVGQILLMQRSISGWWKLSFVSCISFIPRCLMNFMSNASKTIWACHESR